MAEPVNGNWSNENVSSACSSLLWALHRFLSPPTDHTGGPELHLEPPDGRGKAEF